jgi:acyl dehydratase
MRFAEFHVGQKFSLGPIAMTEEAIVRFAKDWDPQPFHIDPASAAAGRWGGLIASGWHTASQAMRVLVEQILAGSESIGSPGLNYLKWLLPVRPGDQLTVQLEVLEVKTSPSGRIGSVLWRWIVENQVGKPVLETEATSLFELKSPKS